METIKVETEESSVQVFTVTSNVELEPLATCNMERQTPDLSWLKCMYGCEIDEKKEVVKLECFHFLCSDECIEKLKRDTDSEVGLKCLQCSMVIPASQFSVKIIPADIFIMKMKAKDVKLICNYCLRKNPAVAHCPECSASLCVECKDLHPQMVATADHKVVNDVTPLKILALPQVLEEKSKCKIHAKPGDSFCRRCKLRICELCTPDHEEHEPIPMDIVKEALRLKIENARTLVEQCRKATVDIDQKGEELQTTQLDRTMESIDDYFRELQDELMKRKEKMKEETRTYFTRLVAKLNKKKECLGLIKAHNEQLGNVGKYMFNYMADIAAAKLWADHEKLFDQLENLEANEAQLTKFVNTVEQEGRLEVNLSSATVVKKFLSKIGGFKFILKLGDCMDDKPVDDEQVDGQLRIQDDDDNVIESQHDSDNATSSTSCGSEKEDDGNDECSNVSNIEGEPLEDSIKTGELADANGNTVLDSSLFGNIDKGTGDDGKLQKGVIQTPKRKRQVAVKSTGCAQVTARSLERFNAAKQLQMKENIDENGVDKHVENESNIESEMVEAVSNGDGRMEAVSNRNDQMEASSNGGGDRMEADPNVAENRQQEQVKRRRKRNENPDFLYFSANPRRSKRIEEKKESLIAPTEETCTSNNSQLFANENYDDLMEEVDELDHDIVPITAATQTVETTNGQIEYDDHDGNPIEPVAGPSFRFGTETVQEPVVPKPKKM